MYAIITENDESTWQDNTGVSYHFPIRYAPILKPGTQVIYYKGKLRNRLFKDKRKSIDPHYFGYGVIGEIIEDTNSPKKDFFAKIVNYVEFEKPILAKLHTGDYIEKIPEQRKNNYWRDGVRKIDYQTYVTILSLPHINEYVLDQISDELISYKEGDKTFTYTPKYERDPKLRKKVIDTKGTTCFCCNFNFENFYGEIGKGFIHIHHIKPLHIFGGKATEVTINDLVPVCPNCHAMIHRNKSHTLSIEELKEYIAKNK